MKFKLKYQPEKGGDWPFRCEHNSLSEGPVPFEQFKAWDEWCTQTFKSGSWYRSGASIWCQHREDALMFIMRWS